jgi:hypothetical protein
MSGIIVRKWRQTKTIGLLCFDEVLNRETDAENLAIIPQQQYRDPSMMASTGQRPTTRSDIGSFPRRNMRDSPTSLPYDMEKGWLKRVLLVGAAVVLAIVVLILLWQLFLSNQFPHF